MPKLGSVRAALKANSAARSDGGQDLTVEITVKISRVSKESEEAMSLCVFVLTAMQWRMSLHVPYI